ncbi:methyltransferase [Rhodococcus ruber Chol-4]|uniref:O-methyltransferase n=1 Tax=Rhodococcus TaxID=1827 RepID=UPI00029A9116|nr:MULTISPECIES: O-methyltransferase [Rhodococcus]MDO2381647.1 O-methyltransferase [Rhodococcus ruber]ATQ31407.1 O-methyltransferase [Rhodococcus ruber]AUM15965.1 O-methyltransferase [Rhodococcus ruber]AWG98342.1 O-methyltransferase [Rhodococcus ruber]AXY51251.1 O-methyltransferase [Rhodococcus ruber]
MHTNAERILAHVENVTEDDNLATARERALDLGAEPIPAAVGAALAMFTRMLDARTVVEVGTGAGVSGLWLLRGLREDGVLTTIDSEPEHQRAAKTAFREAGVTASRTRLINGRALDVLPRLADSAYDLVFVDATPADHPHYVREGVRLLRPGGAIVLHHALLCGRVADPAERDSVVLAVREATRAVVTDERLAPVLLPVGDGLLCAAKL